MNVESDFLANISEMESRKNHLSTYPLGPVKDHEYHVLNKWLSAQGISQQFSPQHHGKYLPTPSSPTQHYIMLPFDKSFGQGVLRYITSNELRKRVYSMISSQPESNLPLISRLILLRQKLSKLMGFNSYGERILSRKVLQNSSGVLSLLRKLSEATSTQISQELKTLEKVKEMMYGGSLSSMEKKIFPWDIPFLGDVYAQTQKQQNSSGTSHDGAVREFQQYCGLDACLSGLELVCESIFGIHMKREILHQTEIWTDHSEDLIKYTLSHTEDGSNVPLGTIYIDLYTRDHKFGGASHFTVRCGCSNTATTSSELPPKIQLPIVALVFSYPKNAQGEIYLTPHQLENLYHEWGHALHSLLSRTKFQHLSGTRGSAEFAEVRIYEI